MSYTSMLYYLCNGKSPVGAYPEGEDTIHFDPSKIEVKKIDDIWTIVEGCRCIMKFNLRQIEAIDEAEARQAFAVIQKYGFTNICFVGKPEPDLPMTYFRQ